jgi:hypothetical protein
MPSLTTSKARLPPAGASKSFRASSWPSRAGLSKNIVPAVPSREPAPPLERDEVDVHTSRGKRAGQQRGRAITSGCCAGSGSQRRDPLRGGRVASWGESSSGAQLRALASARRLNRGRSGVAQRGKDALSSRTERDSEVCGRTYASLPSRDKNHQWPL